MSADNGRLLAERIHQGHDIAGQVQDAVRPDRVRAVRPAVSALVRGYRVKSGRRRSGLDLAYVKAGYGLISVRPGTPQAVAIWPMPDDNQAGTDSHMALCR